MNESVKRSISYSPTDGLTYDPENPLYWKPELLQKEVTRTFEICHGCRLCFKYCDSFPSLFDSIDKRHDGEVEKLTAAETKAVMDDCFQCKLCEVQCPYTQRDGHEYQLDFPRLVHRYKAIEAKEHGISLRDRILGDPDAAGKAARASLGLANAMNRVDVHRWFMEKILGIDRRKLLPQFAATTFERWAETTGRIEETPGAEAVLFQTCYVQNNEPEIGRDTVEVLEKNQVKTACVKGLQCCGMPVWEHGDLETLRRNAHDNLDILMPYVEAGAKVLVINPTCAMVMRREYPELLAGEDRERAKKLAAAVQDTGEFLWSIRKEERFSREFKSAPEGTVAYHAPCHLRAQAIGFKGRDLLRMIPGVVPQTTMECCGHDGTYSMKVEGFEASARIGQPAFNGMKQTGGEVWATECPLAAIQFEQHAGRKPMHPMSILARAYRENGFPRAVVPEEKKKS
ncbi:MAG TPA: heterodisulfide reductase-related iron-sulfur binding cluster [Thermoanaerobaculia bacterium]|nr:heterodisulfide reductase-related iron-sulfur binding cluster [Thermoanaerobaculia bacterium]